MLPLFRPRRPEQKFWDWFLRHQRSLFTLEKDRDNLFRALASSLAKVNGQLTFEFGPVIDGRREFVISAGGIKDAFPSVIALTDAAPPLEQWTITPFRPRRTDISSVQIGPVTVCPDDVHFTLSPNDHLVDIALYFNVPGTAHREVLGQIGFLLLDESLGEFDVEMLVGAIEFLPASSSSHLPKYPLCELPKRFDAMVKRISH
ncbi:MAG: hypothetical protein HUU02_13450 [Bacteroidetes bacterium]|nr:hypothetical protein [Bacteroidota bacterium]